MCFATNLTLSADRLHEFPRIKFVTQASLRQAQVYPVRSIIHGFACFLFACCEKYLFGK